MSRADHLILQDCEFHRNRAIGKDLISASGGAVFASGSMLEIEEGYFVHNEAQGARGGAILAAMLEVHMTDGYFYDNRSKDGGAVYDTPNAPS